MLHVTSVHSEGGAPVILGKENWLFYRYEILDASESAGTDISLDLVRRFNKVLFANGIGMAMAIVPLKMRIYSEYLPDNIKTNDYMSRNYERASRALREARVNVVDLNSAFMDGARRNTESPLFFRLDTHWSPAGALLAAETIMAGIQVNPALKAALDATPEENYKMVSGSLKRPFKGGDLIAQLPKMSPAVAPEQVAPLVVKRVPSDKEGLTGSRQPTGIALVGSSYSYAWTGFQDALRYALQRDVSSLAVGVGQGAWSGMETYLRSNQFQAHGPRLLIWEMPERELRGPPDYRFRDTRFASDNNEWLLRVSALAQRNCRPAMAMPRLARVSLAAKSANVLGEDVVAGPTKDGDFIQIDFDKPIETLDYLSVRVTTAGSMALILEGSGPGVPTRRFTLSMPGDDVAQTTKIALPSNGAGFSKVRIFPGKSNGFKFQGLQVCRQPEDLLS
ncbi:MAG: alginate O-acetyltransferase AlgX-related protein [Rhodoferax sp.]